MVLEIVLKSLLESSTGYPVFALQKEPEQDVPCIVYRYIADAPIISHNGWMEFNRARLQLTCIANSYAELRTVVSEVETTLFGNKTDFDACIPLETKLESKEDNLYYSIRDYYFWYNV